MHFLGDFLAASLNLFPCNGANKLSKQYVSSICTVSLLNKYRQYLQKLEFKTDYTVEISEQHQALFKKKKVSKMVSQAVRALSLQILITILSRYLCIFLGSGGNKTLYINFAT